MPLPASEITGFLNNHWHFDLKVSSSEVEIDENFTFIYKDYKLNLSALQF